MDVAIIGSDAYCMTCMIKEAQFFAVCMRNLEYQAEKKSRLETNLRTIIPVEYYDF